MARNNHDACLVIFDEVLVNVVIVPIVITSCELPFTSEHFIFHSPLDMYMLNYAM